MIPALLKKTEVAPDVPTMADIVGLEQELLQLPQADFPLRHFWAPGLYAREMFIPQGAWLTGAVHKHAHLVTFSGDITVFTDGAIHRFTGHQTVTSLPGAKRAGYAHADTYCTGYFLNPDDETDVRKLEDRYVEDAHLLMNNRAIGHEEAPCLEQAEQ